MIGLRKARHELGLTQSEVARRTGSMHPNSIYLIEAGKRNPGWRQRYLVAKVMTEAGWDGNPEDLFKEVEE